MFGLSPLELRLALYGALLAVIGGWLVYERAHLIAEGEARIKASDAKAVQIHDEAVAAQKAKDEKDKADVVQNLQSQLEELRQKSLNPPAARSMRLCLTARSSDEGRPPSSVPGGSQPAKPSDQGGDSGVRGGAGTGADYGPAVRDLATAGVLLADYRQACINWAQKQSQPIKGN
jgi:hypothetical protein